MSQDVPGLWELRFQVTRAEEEGRSWEGVQGGLAVRNHWFP
jgi:hypothetical protein